MDLWVAIMLIAIFRYDSLDAGISTVYVEKWLITGLGQLLMRVEPLAPKGSVGDHQYRNHNDS